jgi:hypothetical protein
MNVYYFKIHNIQHFLRLCSKRKKRLTKLQCILVHACFCVLKLWTLCQIKRNIFLWNVITKTCRKIWIHRILNNYYYYYYAASQSRRPQVESPSAQFLLLLFLHGLGPLVSSDSELIMKLWILRHLVIPYLLDGWSAHRNASTYTTHRYKTRIFTHTWHGIWTGEPIIRMVQVHNAVQHSFSTVLNFPRTMLFAVAKLGLLFSL